MDDAPGLPTGPLSARSPPQFYDGQAFMVPQRLGVEVAAYQLDSLRVCILDQGDEQQALQEFAFVNQSSWASRFPTRIAKSLTVAYRQGLCEAVSAPASWPVAMRRGLPDFSNASHPALAHQQIGDSVRSSAPTTS